MDAREVELPESDFFISHEGNVEGPISKKEIQSRLEHRKLEFTDYVWLAEEQEWQMLAMYFSSKYPPPTEPPAGVMIKAKPLKEYKQDTFSQNIGISNEPIWFLYREKNKFGPYRYLDLVKLLQEKQCAPDDFVWKPGMPDWQRIHLTPEFEDAVLKKLSHLKNFSVEKVFVERRFPRVPYDAEVILHDEQKVVFGNVTSISEGGAFVEVKKPTHVRGDRLKIHFTPGAVSIPFNCIAEVTQVMKSKPIGYCVKFIYLEEEDRGRIAQFANKISKNK